MSNIKEVLQKIEKGISPFVGRRKDYQMTAEEMFILGEYALKYPLECVATVFDYGFFKGVRWQKKQEEKRRKHEHTKQQ